MPISAHVTTCFRRVLRIPTQVGGVITTNISVTHDLLQRLDTLLASTEPCLPKHLEAI